MFLSDIGGPLLRRWYIVLLGVLATVGLCLGAARAFPATYQANANVVFLPPKSAVGDTGNPYLALGGLDTAASVVAHAMSDSATVHSLAESGVSGFTIVPDLAAGGPVLLVTADGATPRAALDSLAVVLERLPQVLDKLQSSVGTPRASLITQEIITRDTVAEPVRKKLIRILLLVGAAGLGGTVLLTALIDGLLMRPGRRARPETTTVRGTTSTLAGTPTRLYQTPTKTKAARLGNGSNWRERLRPERIRIESTAAENDEDESVPSY